MKLVVPALLCAFWVGAQTPPPQPPPQQQPPQRPAPTQPRDPFESVPTTQEQQPGQPQLEAPKAQPGTQLQGTGQVIDAIEFRGARRVPQDTLKAMISSKAGDILNEEALRRDFMYLWNTGRFDDIRLETEPGSTPNTVIVRFVVTERRVIRSINYEGIHSVTVSEILDRFKERKVGLVVESQYDPNKIQRATIVLKEYLSERGRQYATVDPQIEQIPPSSLKITFNVKEGPKVKVGEITIVGNNSKPQRWVINAMKYTRPYGIPHSILFENLFAKTYDQEKLETDMELVRQAYQDIGYFQAKTLDEKVKIIPKGGKGWRLPLIKTNSPGIYADVTVPVEEGRLFHLHAFNYVGMKAFRPTDALTKAIFGMGPGDVFSTDKLRKGIKFMSEGMYGRLGFIDFVPEPSFAFPGGDQIDVTLDVDEGKQFFVRRIDFAGNTTTRDKVIRRELLIDEGYMFNSELWDLSILRLNQLGYFEVLKKEEAADIKRNTGSNTVDITLKVKERGKNSIGLNGGVSGIAGSFVGFNYSTNNFLGLGETLSLNAQVGTRMTSTSFSFVEPYFLDLPLQLGFTVFLQRFSFDQAREASVLAGYNLIPLYNQLGSQNLLNYIQNSHGFNVSASYPLPHSFSRFGVTYGFDISNIVTQTTAAGNYFQYINFSGVYGPNALEGIRTSTITPSYQYNTVNHPVSPTGGRSLYLSMGFSGSVLGGNVNMMTPAVDAKYFRLSPLSRKHVLAFHLLSSWKTGYGGKLIPPYSRTFIGGEQDVRGFDIWGITPIAYIPTSSSVPVYNADGTPRTQKVVSGASLVAVPVNMTLPAYQLITPGGDFQTVFNFEYRIPIIGHTVTLAPFFDGGVNKILKTNQLTMDPQRVSDLNQQFPQAGYSGKVQIAPGTQKPRASTGLELQVMLPVVNAPFRVYFAYNPSIVRETLIPPIVADRAAFPNAATFVNAITNSGLGQAYPFLERHTLFRFTIGRTF